LRKTEPTADPPKADKAVRLKVADSKHFRLRNPENLQNPENLENPDNPNTVRNPNNLENPKNPNNLENPKNRDSLNKLKKDWDRFPVGLSLFLSLSGSRLVCESRLASLSLLSSINLSSFLVETEAHSVKRVCVFGFDWRTGRVSDCGGWRGDSSWLQVTHKSSVPPKADKDVYFGLL